MVTCIDYKILGGSSHSDHHPVWRHLWFEEETKRRSHYVRSNLYLKEFDVQTKIRKIWYENASLGFFGKLRKCVKFYKMYYINKAAKGRQEEENLRQHLEVARTKLQTDLDNLAFQTDVANLVDKILQVEKNKVSGQRLQSRIKWKEVGDQCSKEVFQTHRLKSSSAYITNLEDHLGQLHTNLTDPSQI